MSAECGLSKRVDSSFRFLTPQSFWLRREGSNQCFLIQSQASCRLDDTGKKLARTGGLEPPTCSFVMSCSDSIELRPRDDLAETTRLELARGFTPRLFSKQLRLPFRHVSGKLAEDAGFEPASAGARWFSGPLPYQLG